MKTLIVVAILTLLVITVLYWFNRKNSSSVNIQVHGPFTIKKELFSQHRLNSNFKIVKETNVAYSVWYKGAVVQYPGALQNNTGYSHLWRVYILGGAPKPTLIAGSQSLFMITEQDGKPVVTSLNTPADDFASLQYLDENNGQPGLVKNVFMTNAQDSIETLRGGKDLFINNGLILHVPNLSMHFTLKQNQYINEFYFMKAGGAVAVSPDKKYMVFLGGKNVPAGGYESAMIVCGTDTDSAYTVPYSRTKTRSINLNENNREWFKTYFEWVANNNSYKLQLKKYNVLPYWAGLYKDKDIVYQLKPVRIELQPVFLEFILEKLALTKDAVLPPEQYYINSVYFKHRDFVFTLWYNADDEELLLMMKDINVSNAAEQVALIHQLGDAFDKELLTGKYQEYFTELQ